MGLANKRVNPKVSSSVNRNFDELAMKEIVKAVIDVGPLWENKNQRGTLHHPIVIVVCCILKVMMDL